MPSNSGVYQFFDKTGQLLYIGKAKNLKNRVKSYFVDCEKILTERGPAIFQMVEQIAKLKIIETDSEIEAIFLEAEMINKLKPKYNSRQKDDKSFYLIRIDKSEIPTVELVRVRNVNLKNRQFYYFGPYSSADLIKRSLRILRKIFPYRNCSKTKFSRQEKLKRACLYGDIKLCEAPCSDNKMVLENQKNVNYIRQFLSGKKKNIVREMEKELIKKVKIEDFESAAILRDKIAALSHLHRFSVGIRDSFFDFQNFSRFARIEAYDISNIGGDFAVGGMTVATLGKIDKDEYRKFKIKTVSGANDIAMMIEVLSRRIKNDWPLPNLLIIDGGATHLKAVSKLFENKNIPIVAIAKGPDRKKDEFHFSSPGLAEIIGKNIEIKNLILQLRDESHRFSQSYYRSLHRKSLTE